MDRDPNNADEERWVPALSPGRTKLVFWAMLLVLFFAALDQTIVSTALPLITADLHDLQLYAWVATSYMLTSTVTVPIYGKLSDIVGRKNILLFGVAVFLIGSVGCALAPSMTWLIIARAVQGLGAGALIPVAFATMANLFSPREIGKYQGLISIVFVLASLIGPPLGGWISSHFGWRWAFFINFPVGVLAAGLLIWFMPSFKPAEARPKIDYLGAILLMITMTLVLFALEFRSSSLNTIGLALSAVAGFALLMIHEFRVQDPILNPRHFKNSVFSVSTVVTFATGAVMLSLTYYLPVLIQVVLHRSATEAGSLLIPFSIAIGLGATISGWHTAKSGRYKWNAVTGALLSSIGLGLLWLWSADNSTAKVIVASCIGGLGLGVSVSLYATIVRNALPMAVMGEGLASLTLARQLGATAGIAFSSMLMSNHIGGTTLASSSAGNALIVDASTQAAFSAGLSDVYFGLFILAVISTVLLLVALKEIPLRGSKPDKELDSDK